MLRRCALRVGDGTHPVQVPHAALFLVVFLQGVIAVKLPGTRTHAHRKRAEQRVSSDRTAELVLFLLLLLPSLRPPFLQLTALLVYLFFL